MTPPQTRQQLLDALTVERFATTTPEWHNQARPADLPQIRALRLIPSNASLDEFNTSADHDARSA
jgi:hypothetical protein